MLVAHLSDLHLGHEAFERVERGRNARERDVGRAFQGAVAEILRLRPAVVLVSGDVFDHPQPPPAAYATLLRGLETLRNGLPGATVLIAAGSRDTPLRHGEPGPLAALEERADVEIATGTARSVVLSALDLHVLLVPHRAALREPFPEVRPEEGSRWNVVVAHGRPGREGLAIDPAGWDYVALGSEHTARALAPRVRYAGSLERIGLDPWDEAVEEKGFWTFDLESGDAAFHAVGGRPVVSLAPTPVRAGDPAALNRRIREVLEEVPGGIDGKIVRLRLRSVPRAWLRLLDRDVLGAARERALHLAVTVDESEEERGEGGEPLESALARIARASGASAEVEAIVAKLDREGDRVP